MKIFTRKFWRESWREATIASKKILTIKDIFLSLQAIAIVIGFISHLTTCHKLDTATKEVAVVSHQKDSVMVKVEHVRMQRDSAYRIADSCVQTPHHKHK